MRTLLLALLLMAAPAAAEPDPLAGSVKINITELTISGGGGVDPAIMRRAFDDTVDAADRCYDSVKSRPARLNATVTLKFRIDDRGAVAKASAVGLPSVNTCIAAAVKALVFDAPNNGAVDVTEKLSFRTTTTAGILGSTAGQTGGAFASLTGTGDVSTDDANIYGGLLGSEDGEINGGFGYGRSGFGPAGGGTGWGTIGTGRIGRGAGGSKGAGGSVPTVSIGQPSAQGDLDKAIIRRYIKRNIQKIQYCYEKQLLAKPRLSGTVQVQFTIGGDGKVTGSTGSGVDASIASCVAEVIEHIEFPKPRTDGIVTVKYPFVFRPGDDAKRP